MFFDSIEQIKTLAERAGCTIFVIKNGIEIDIKNALIIRPGIIKNGIVMEQVQEILPLLKNKQRKSQFIIIYEADKMNQNAANAFLKSLEEPRENYHFILQTEDPSMLLSTIRSRSELFIQKQEDSLGSDVVADEKIKTIARKLIAADDKNLIQTMNEITKKKDDMREYSLQILRIAIEICYKSYFKTNNKIFIKKLSRLIKAYENIAANGNIKLHLIADML